MPRDIDDFDIDDFASGVVDQIRASFHPCELGGGDHIEGVGESGDVKRDKVGLGQECWQGLDLLGLTQWNSDVGDVVEENPHPE